MTINDWLLDSTSQLSAAGIETARLDALVLLADILNKNSAQLLAEPDVQLSNEQKQRLAVVLKRRLAHEPLAYIRGHNEFYGLQFAVDQHVLVPRPETETMIDLLKSLPAAAQKNVVDVGTGSGAIAITAACELENAQIIATDIDPRCLELARQNAVTNRVVVDFRKANLVAGLKLAKDTTILANLPYVPNAHPINQAAKHEPRLALFGGEDGLDLYCKLFQQLQNARHQGYVLTEALPFQHAKLVKIAKQHDYQHTDTQDFIQVFKKG